MKQRIVSAVIGLTLLGCVLIFADGVIFNIVIALVSLVALYEVLAATKYIQNRALVCICMAFAVCVPICKVPALAFFAPVCYVLFALALFVLLIAKHETMRIEQIGLAFLLSVAIVYGFDILLLLRDRFWPDARFYIIMALAAPWLTDAGAYFIGSAFGKTKLAPKISPKKTVEGAVGGVVVCMLLFTLLGFAYGLITPGVDISYFSLLASGFLCSIASMLGDLSASIIKRQCGVKDFGNVLPGHGGVLDRFDSVLFSGPLFYYFMLAFPIVIR